MRGSLFCLSQSNKEGVVLLMEAIEKSGHLDKVNWFLIILSLLTDEIISDIWTASWRHVYHNYSSNSFDPFVSPSTIHVVDHYKVILGMDVASSEFHVDGKYDLYKKTRKAGSTEPMMSSKELAEFYKVLIWRNNRSSNLS